jgi:hypothetical protein
MNRKQLAKYLDGTHDPMTTVPHLTDGMLGQLTDALYGHLDTPHPAFEAHTWYDLAIEEACRRSRAGISVCTGALPVVRDGGGSSIAGPAL